MNERVKQKRIEKELSINELARRSGVDKKTIRLLEAGTRKPKQATLEAIAKGLALPLRNLPAKTPRITVNEAQSAAVVTTGAGNPLMGVYAGAAITPPRERVPS